jgi:hypothetical protein
MRDGFGDQLGKHGTDQYDDQNENESASVSPENHFNLQNSKLRSLISPNSGFAKAILMPLSNETKQKYSFDFNRIFTTALRGVFQSGTSLSKIGK